MNVNLNRPQTLTAKIYSVGEDGRGIQSIAKTSTSGQVDTYTVTYTDSTTYTFTITNGAEFDISALTAGTTIDNDDLLVYYDDSAEAAKSITWSNFKTMLSNSYAALSHTHTKSQITDFPTVPTKTSDLTNDSGFLTQHQDISGKQDTLIAGTNITIAADGKTISAAGGSSAEWGQVGGTLSDQTDLQTALDGKVNTESGKGLSTNDYDATEKAAVSANTSARHTHSNKSLLDTYTQTEANIAEAVTAKHTHSNKAILDATTASFTGHQDISGKEDTSNKVTSLSSSSTDTQYPSAKCVADLLNTLSAEMEVDANKVTSLSSSSTDTQYPSAKCVYDLLDGKQDTLTAGTNISIVNNVISASGGGGETTKTWVKLGEFDFATDPVSSYVIDTYNGTAITKVKELVIFHEAVATSGSYVNINDASNNNWQIDAQGSSAQPHSYYHITFDGTFGYLDGAKGNQYWTSISKSYGQSPRVTAYPSKVRVSVNTGQFTAGTATVWGVIEQ